MSLGDQISRILIDVKAETKGARQSLHELNGAIEAVGKVTQFAREAMTEYDDHLRLMTATANVNIESLTKAFRGLVNEHDILTFAAQTQTGILALNQAEMEKVAQAALALRNRGFGAEEALKKLTDAAVKGKVGGLDDLGLSIKEGASRAETLRNMMAELDKVIKDSGGTYNESAESIRRLGVEWDNAAAAAKRYSVEVLKAIDFDKIGELKKLMAAGLSPQEAMGELVSRQGARTDLAAQQTKDRAASSLDRRKAEMGVIEMADDDLSGEREKRKKAFADANKKAQELASQKAKDWTDLLVAQLEDEIANRDPQSVTGGLSTIDGIGNLEIKSDDLVDALRKLEDASRMERRMGYLETAFGPIEQFDAYQQGFETLGSVFNSFNEAVGASYETIVTGQGSVSAAFRKVFADSLMAMGKASVVSALRETALGVGALAVGSPTAMMHFKSAGLHAAVAVAAGVAANALGTSASDKGSTSTGGTGTTTSSGGSGASGGASSGGGTSSGEDKSRPIVVVLGSAFDETTPRQRAKSAQAAVDKAIRERDE